MQFFIGLVVGVCLGMAYSSFMICAKIGDDPEYDIKHCEKHGDDNE